MDDKNLTCADCSSEFVWTGKEQEFYASKNLHQPRRCKACRDKKKALRGDR